MEVDAKRMSGLKYKLVCCFKLAADMGHQGLSMTWMDQHSCKKRTGGIWCG